MVVTGMVLRYLPFFYHGFRLQYTFLTLRRTYCILIFLSSAILIALVKPYKITYVNVRQYDPTVNCGSSRYYEMAVPALFCLCIFNLLPALLLMFYPRRCLSKCNLDSLSLTAFTEKFYGCYRDGLDGGRDMRSFAGFYFLLRYLPFLFYSLGLQHTFLTLWNYCILIFLSSEILTTLVKPYKITYVNGLDTLLLSLAAYSCAILSQEPQSSHLFQHLETHFFIIFCIPPLAFGLVLLSAMLIQLYRLLSIGVKRYSLSEPDDQLQPLLLDGTNNSHN